MEGDLSMKRFGKFPANIMSNACTLIFLCLQLVTSTQKYYGICHYEVMSYIFLLLKYCCTQTDTNPIKTLKLY